MSTNQKTIMIAVPKLDEHGNGIGTDREPAPVFFRSGDWAVVGRREQSEGFSFFVAHVPSGRKTQFMAYRTLVDAIRYCGAFADVFDGIDPLAVSDRDQLEALRGRVRELAECDACQGGDTKLEGAFDMEGS